MPSCPSSFLSLPYTCRLLYAETAGIELSLNDLIFYYHPKRTGTYVKRPTGVQFLGFLDMCDEKWRCCIRKVWLRNDINTNGRQDVENEDRPVDLHVVIDNLSHYRNMHVIWEFKLDYSSEEHSLMTWISEGLYWEKAFRDIDIFNESRIAGLEPISGLIRRYSSNWRLWRPVSRGPQISDRPMEQLNVPNFRFIPWGREPWGRAFDEAQFRKILETVRMSSERSDEIKERWVELAKRWYTDGM
ncbi:hypothetical protein EJ04DRAFT_556952 [Polyplosphaeria fusca]|uniref:Uncharacterized protein n=1 Tax=Polyplosphaeria fusca TaxID=682080 RepID=A0A9P4QIV0_9PLEO|nr:hypothetical protein EJ04DRAFT_556952 [Polyplosphaeria fusca]